MSNDAGKHFAEQLTPLATGWTAALAAATGGLYAAGYLSLRCQLTALGVAAELHVIDERYLFAGASFLLYLLTVLPSLLLVVAAGGCVLWLAGRVLPAKLRKALADRCRRWGAAFSEPRRLTVLGILWALVAIQLVMRHAFYLDKLLLGPLPCEPRWLVAVLYDTGGVLPPLYFAGLLVLVAAVSTSAAITELTVTLNGRVVNHLEGTAKNNPRERMEELEVDLAAGENELTFVAATARAQSAPVLRARRRARPRPVARPAGAGRHRPRRSRARAASRPARRHPAGGPERGRSVGAGGAPHDDGHRRPVLVCLDSLRLAQLPEDREPINDLLNRLRSAERRYGETVLVTKTHSNGKGSDVGVRRSERAAIDVSRCRGDFCGQGALSRDGRRVVFVRTSPP